MNFYKYRIKIFADPALHEGIVIGHAYSEALNTIIHQLVKEEFDVTDVYLQQLEGGTPYIDADTIQQAFSEDK